MQSTGHQHYGVVTGSVQWETCKKVAPFVANMLLIQAKKPHETIASEGYFNNSTLLYLLAGIKL